MPRRQHGSHVVILAGLLGGGIAIATVALDASAIIGLALLGAPLGAWFVLYDQVMCKNERVSWSLTGAGAGLGASVLPVLAALEHVLGDPVWMFAVALVVVWAVMNSINSAGRRPHRTAID